VDPDPDWTFLGEGWCSRVYLVNDELVFKFPKHAEAWKELHREIRFLEFAADKLPLAVPRYLHVAPEYAVYQYLRGRAVDPDAADADTLAEFLRAMHGLNPDPELRELLPCEDRRAVAEEYFVRAEREIAPKLSTQEAARLRREFEMYLIRHENFLFQPVVVHGDFAADHILADDSIKAVIDFGDVSWGDPDYDFMYLFVDFGWAFVEKIARSYGHPDLERLRRKCRYFAIVDQIGTIVDGPGQALAGQEDAAWRRLRRFLQGD